MFAAENVDTDFISAGIPQDELAGKVGVGDCSEIGVRRA